TAGDDGRRHRLARMGSTPLHRSAAAALLVAATIASTPLARAIDQRKPPLPARVWYVDNAAASDGDSRGLDGGIRLRSGQRLVGSGAPFTPEGEGPLPAGEPPLLSAAAGPVVTLADHVRLEGLAVSAHGAVAVSGDDVADVR